MRTMTNSSTIYNATRYKALLLDVYGTLVEEDDAIVSEIVRTIATKSPLTPTVQEVSRAWRFQEECAASFGVSFRTQRRIEQESLVELAALFKAEVNVTEMCEWLFDYWQKPLPFDDGFWFVENCPLPVCLVSNIDTRDLQNALTHLGWHFADIVTSEQCRSYKPREEMFRYALQKMQCEAHEVLHIGDSFTSDVTGAQKLGIEVAWVNRNNRRLSPEGHLPTLTVGDLRSLPASVVGR